MLHVQKLIHIWTSTQRNAAMQTQFGLFRTQQWGKYRY